MSTYLVASCYGIDCWRRDILAWMVGPMNINAQNNENKSSTVRLFIEHALSYRVGASLSPTLSVQVNGNSYGIKYPV